MSFVLFAALAVGFIIIVIFIANRKKVETDPTISALKDRLAALDKKYLSLDIREVDRGAYTENKRAIFLCLRDPETGKYYDMNTLVYVVLHEIAHMSSVTYGHNHEFHQNFARLLRQATQKGVFDPTIPIPTKYCGVDSQHPST
ncbi:putative metallopeptidase WLM [Golden Marseillevirus]|uniref:putative metallopeptidase WLM n=1 Tax=Golden Marseillevirus TaxID=1720526 RepID=UPI000877AB0C|nr:putative metallopeptidase WLM [Golden Marseillevirus]ALX27560.1 putative metallopeptidase WLM [Golden Marseillevirus]